MSSGFALEFPEYLRQQNNYYGTVYRRQLHENLENLAKLGDATKEVENNAKNFLDGAMALRKQVGA